MTFSHLLIALLVSEMFCRLWLLNKSAHHRSPNVVMIGYIIVSPLGLASRKHILHAFQMMFMLKLCSGMYVFTAAYGISFGPVGWVLPSEVFPLSVRSKGVALSTASNWINNCVWQSSTFYLKGLILRKSSLAQSHLLWCGLRPRTYLSLTLNFEENNLYAGLRLPRSLQHLSLRISGQRIGYLKQRTFHWRKWTLCLRMGWDGKIKLLGLRYVPSRHFGNKRIDLRGTD